jgi:hypothetical protein
MKSLMLAGADLLLLQPFEIAKEFLQVSSVYLLAILELFADTV